jgi:hypothetical protein
VDPVPDPLLLRKSGSAGNRTRTSGSIARATETTEAVCQKRSPRKRRNCVTQNKPEGAAMYHVVLLLGNERIVRNYVIMSVKRQQPVNSKREKEFSVFLC